MTESGSPNLWRHAFSCSELVGVRSELVLSRDQDVDTGGDLLQRLEDGAHLTSQGIANDVLDAHHHLLRREVPLGGRGLVGIGPHTVEEAVNRTTADRSAQGRADRHQPSSMKRS